jgi:hypothetical protein
LESNVSFSMTFLERQGHSVNYAPVAGVTFLEQEGMTRGPNKQESRVGN